MNMIPFVVPPNATEEQIAFSKAKALETFTGLYNYLKDFELRLAFGDKEILRQLNGPVEPGDTVIPKLRLHLPFK